MILLNFCIPKPEALVRKAIAWEERILMAFCDKFGANWYKFFLENAVKLENYDFFPKKLVQFLARKGTSLGRTTILVAIFNAICRNNNF